jgi:hypothetical protein
MRGRAGLSVTIQAKKKIKHNVTHTPEIEVRKVYITYKVSTPHQ